VSLTASSVDDLVCEVDLARKRTRLLVTKAELAGVVAPCVCVCVCVCMCVCMCVCVVCVRTRACVSV
jgi:hypothetical protein